MHGQGMDCMPALCPLVSGARLHVPCPHTLSGQVARSIVKGIEQRDYHIRSVDLGQTLLMDSMASLSPKVLPLALSILLAPITNVVLSVLRWRMDRAVVKAREAGPA